MLWGCQATEVGGEGRSPLSRAQQLGSLGRYVREPGTPGFWLETSFGVALLHPICLWLQEVLILLCLGFVCCRGQSLQRKIARTEGEVSEEKQMVCLCNKSWSPCPLFAWHGCFQREP